MASSLTVTVLFTAMVRLSAVTAALKVALLFNVISASEVAPTIPVKLAEPEPKVNMRSRFVPIASLFTVELKLILLLLVAKVVSPVRVTALL